MTLIYRGQPYTASHTIAPVNPQNTFTYRGQSYQRSAADGRARAVGNAITPKAKLTYRGVPYIQPESTTIKDLTPAVA